MPYDLLTVLCVLAYLGVSAICWYLNGVVCYGLNSGQLGRHQYLFPFQCFLEELPCHLPGGKKYRYDFIQKRIEIGDGGAMCGITKSWTFEEIHTQQCHEEVFREMVGTPFPFWISHISVFAAGPLILGLLLFYAIAYVVVVGPFLLACKGIRLLHAKILRSK